MIIAFIVTGVFIVALGLTVLPLGLRSRRHKRHLDAIEAELRAEQGGPAFEPAWVSHLPEPARRLMMHAIRPGAPLARHVVMEQRATMRPKADRPPVELFCRETLAPGKGLVWRAKGRMGLPVSVLDHYFEGHGAMRVSLMGLLPMVHAQGPDIDRSARGRLAAEALWCPSALVGREDVTWEKVDESRVRLGQVIDGEKIELVLTVGPEGQVESLTMERYGNEGRPDYGMTPYGFDILEERAFGAYTIPSRLRGGWWYGTERYDPDRASVFTVVAAEFGQPVG